MASGRPRTVAVNDIFDTFEELENEIREFGRSIWTLFVKGDCKKFPSDSHEILPYKYIQFDCKRGGKRKPSRSKGIRPNQSTLKCDCPVRLRAWACTRTNGTRVYRISTVNLDHNHSTSELEYLAFPENRQATVTECVEYLLNCPSVHSRDVRQHIQQAQNKIVSAADIRNLKLRLKKNKTCTPNDNVEDFIHSQDFASPLIRQQFKTEGLSSVLQDETCVDDYMMPSTNKIAHEVDNGSKENRISKRSYDTVLDSDDEFGYINPPEVCIKEEFPSNRVKIEPTDIHEETQMVDLNQEPPPEDLHAASDSHTDIDEEPQMIDENLEPPSEDTQAASDSHTENPLTVSESKALLPSDSLILDCLNLCNSASSPVKFNENNIVNQSNISPTSATNDKPDLIGQNLSMVSKSLNSQKSTETAKHVIPSTSKILSSGVKRSQSNMSFKRRRYSFCVDSGSNKQQVLHAQGNATKVCCCPEIHKELLKIERKESNLRCQILEEERNLRCQLLEEERVLVTKEHAARMRLMAKEECLVQMQLRKLQSELDERRNSSS
ncbi:unnamed protein product [Meganyctiphanes norvegica]|uniref:FAR1 domain-containing protein n=1 Tax=Meganyctiphanes norvegica TaxID=48144 RepID=A0AAV2PS02_MEGNR